MINAYKFDRRGYLRLSDILLLEYKLDQALETCAIGMKPLKDDDPQLDLLRQQHDRIHNMLARRQDPFRVLPPEIIYMILEKFTFKQTVAILRVSKDWDQCLSGIGKFWLRLDFSGNLQKKVDWNSVRSCVDRAKGVATHAVFGNILSYSRSQALELLGQCANLEHVKVMDNCSHTVLYRSLRACKKLKTISVSMSTKVPQSYVARFLNELPLLEEVEFQNTKSSKYELWPFELPNLKSLTLRTKEFSPRSVDVVPAIYVPAICATSFVQLHASRLVNANRLVHSLYSMENLEKLCLEWMPPDGEVFLMNPDFERFPRLRHLDLTGIMFTERIVSKFVLPQSLEVLSFRECGNLLSCDEIAQVELKNLHTLVLNEIDDITAEAINRFFTRCKPRLHTLKVVGCYQFDVSLALQLLTEEENWLGDLTLLQLDTTEATDDPIADIILSYMPKLKTVDVSYTYITDAFVRKLADARASNDTSLPKIDALLVKGCDVSDQTLAYARTQGLDPKRGAFTFF